MNELNLVSELAHGVDELNKKKHEVHQVMAAIMPHLIAFLQQRTRQRYHVGWVKDRSSPAIHWYAQMLPGGELDIRCNQGEPEGICIYWFQRAAKGGIQEKLLFEHVETVHDWADLFVTSFLQDAPGVRERVAPIFAAARKGQSEYENPAD